MSAADTLRALAGKKANIDVNRANYHAYVADRVECGGWTPEDSAEYHRNVASVMRSGTDDEKAAAREFWAAKAVCAIPAIGVNDRIKARIKERKK